MVQVLNKLINAREVDAVNVLTDRVKRLRQEYQNAVMHICAERSRLVTESWRGTEGQPSILRAAKAFQKIMEEHSIIIRDHELIVGSQTKYVRGASPPFEWGGEAYAYCIGDISLPGYRSVGVETSEEDGKSLFRDMEYWKTRSVRYVSQEQFRRLMGNLYVDDYDESTLSGDWEARVPAGQDVDYSLVLNRGLIAIIEEARDKLAKLTAFTPDEIYRARFLNAAIIVLEGAITYAKRHTKLARELAKREDDITRKQELEEIAKVCEWVPANPARTFQEALQATQFMLLCVTLEGSCVAEAVGRLDQYLYPFYCKDIREGRINKQEAAELLACFWIKLLEKESVRESGQLDRTQGAQFIQATISGVREDGSDATNELSWLILEVARQLKVHQPHLTLRCHDGLSRDFLIKALETARDIGAGIPQFVNDNLLVARLLSLGISLQDARNNAAFGCSHLTVPGGGILNLNWVVNDAKIFELALNDGIDPRTGKRLGLPTGDPRNFRSFQELYVAFKKQFMHAIAICAKRMRVLAVVSAEMHPLPFISALWTNGINESRDLQDLCAGSRPVQLGYRCSDKGHVDIADSLVAIKKLVFEENKVSMGELLDALAVNFNGREDLRRMLLAAPKWGNDNDEADQIMKDVYEWTAKAVASQTNVWGKPVFSEGRHGTAFHIWAGRKVGALPEGRLAWTHLADGGVSPMTGMDTQGPTAVCNSVTKLDLILSGSNVLNQKFSPELLRNKEGLERLLALIKSYFQNGGQHIQFNIVDRKTLLEAKEHPELHRDLLVRVAGYTARFVDLDPDVQDEIIARTEQGL